MTCVNQRVRKAALGMANIRVPENAEAMSMTYQLIEFQRCSLSEQVCKQAVQSHSPDSNQEHCDLIEAEMRQG